MKGTMARAPRGFTLIELLIVVGILAVLATLVILVINPAELFKQARDVRRISDMKTLTIMINYAKFAGKELGPAATKRVDVSVVGASFRCYGAPANLPGVNDNMSLGWERRCPDSSEYQALNGRGWLEVNVSDPFAMNDSRYLAAVIPYSSTGSLISKLPIDPISTGASGLYYMYLHDAARYDSFEFVTTFESAKYQAQAIGDGGYDPGRYETGSDLVLWREAICTATGVPLAACP